MCGKFQALHLQTISVTLTYFEGHSDIEKVQMKVTFLLSIDPVEFKLLMCRCMDIMHKKISLACGLHLKQIIDVSPAYSYQGKTSASKFCWCIFKRDVLNFVWSLQIISIKMEGVF